MSREEETRGRTRDAQSRVVRLLDPYPLWLRGRFEPIAESELNAIVNDLGIPNRGRRTVVVWLVFVASIFILAVGGIGASVAIEGRPALDDLLSVLRNPALVAGPIGGVIAAFLASRHERMARVRRVLLAHGHCPHCGYRIAGLPAEGSTVRCPECSCLWPRAELDGPALRADHRQRRRLGLVLLVGVGLTVLALIATVLLL